MVSSKPENFIFYYPYLVRVLFWLGSGTHFVTSTQNGRNLTMSVYQIILAFYTRFFAK